MEAKMGLEYPCWAFVFVFVLNAVSSGLGETFLALVSTVFYTLVCIVAAFVLYETLASKQARADSAASALAAAELTSSSPGTACREAYFHTLCK
jgi:hypothetical protein